MSIQLAVVGRPTHLPVWLVCVQMELRTAFQGFHFPKHPCHLHGSPLEENSFVTPVIPVCYQMLLVSAISTNRFRNQHYMTQLVLGIGTESVSCVKQIQNSLDISHERWTALHHACDRRPPHDVVKKLILAYPDALLARDREKGWTPLHHACRFKASVEVIHHLLYLSPNRAKKAASIKGNGGRTPIFFAIRYDAPDGVVEKLLDVDTSGILAEDYRGSSALHWFGKISYIQKREKIL